MEGITWKEIYVGARGDVSTDCVSWRAEAPDMVALHKSLYGLLYRTKASNTSATEAYRPTTCSYADRAQLASLGNRSDCRGLAVCLSVYC